MAKDKKSPIVKTHETDLTLGGIPKSTSKGKFDGKIFVTGGTTYGGDDSNTPTPTTTTTTTLEPEVFSCQLANPIIEDDIVGQLVNVITDLGNVVSVSPETHQVGSQIYDVTIEIPEGYENAGETMICFVEGQSYDMLHNVVNSIDGAFSPNPMGLEATNEYICSPTTPITSISENNFIMTSGDGSMIPSVGDVLYTVGIGEGTLDYGHILVFDSEDNLTDYLIYLCLNLILQHRNVQNINYLLFLNYLEPEQNLLSSYRHE